MTKKHVAGIDLGGSKISAIVVSDKGKCLGKCRARTPKERSFEIIAQAMGECLNEALGRAGLSLQDLGAVGIGVPGPVDPTGRVAVMPNLGLVNVHVAEEMSSALGKNVRVENDVNLATLAEFRLGAGRGLRSLYGIFPGTGVGGGYVIEGEIVKGKNNTAGEIGHMIVKIDGPECGCGRNGCLEAFVSKSGIVRELREARERGHESVLMKFADGGFKTVEGSDLIAAWEANDPLAHQLLREQARILGIAVANVVNLTGIEGIVIGGSVYEDLGDELLPILEETASQYAIGNGMAGVRLVPSDLKGDATAVGAALIAVE